MKTFGCCVNIFIVAVLAKPHFLAFCAPGCMAGLPVRCGQISTKMAWLVLHANVFDLLEDSFAVQVKSTSLLYMYE